MTVVKPEVKPEFRVNFSDKGESTKRGAEIFDLTTKLLTSKTGAMKHCPETCDGTCKSCWDALLPQDLGGEG